MQKISIIIDCDPGVDDTTALIYALREPRFNVLAIHTVAGNVNVDQTTENVCRLLDYFGENVPVCRGANEPLVKPPVYADDIHGQNGLGGMTLPEATRITPSNRTALESYVHLLQHATEPIHIVAVGPLTNVAILLKGYPELKAKIACIHIMGGGIKGGNITACGEFNFYVDPHAAHIVLESGVPIVMAGLDVTERATLWESDYETLRQTHPTIGQFLLDLTQQSFERYEKIDYGRVCTPNDLVPFVHLFHPEIFQTKKARVHVATNSGETQGLTYIDQRLLTPVAANCEVILDVDQLKFRQVCMEGFRRW